MVLTLSNTTQIPLGDWGQGHRLINVLLKCMVKISEWHNVFLVCVWLRLILSEFYIVTIPPLSLTSRSGSQAEDL